jgi:hypothetical protein
MYSPLEEPIEDGRNGLEGSREGPKDSGAGFEGNRQDIEGNRVDLRGDEGIFEGDRGDYKGRGIYWPQSDEEFIQSSLHTPATTPTPTLVTTCHDPPSPQIQIFYSHRVSICLSSTLFTPQVASHYKHHSTRT